MLPVFRSAASRIPGKYWKVYSGNGRSVGPNVWISCVVPT